MATYTYDPNLADSVSQIRFALGDVCLEEPYLTDEEIKASIAQTKSLKQAQLKLVESLLHRFSYEVTTKVKDVQWNLSDRINAWKGIYARLKGEVESEELISGAWTSGSSKGRAPIFKVGMNDWRGWACI